MVVDVRDIDVANREMRRDENFLQVRIIKLDKFTRMKSDVERV